MKKPDREQKTFLAIVSTLIIIKLTDTILAPNHVFPGRTASFPSAELILASVLGYIGITLAKKTSIPKMWDEKITNKERIKTPLLTGIILGIILALFDSYACIGDMSVGFPLSVIFYTWGAITTELIMHIFPLALVTWLVGIKILKKHESKVFWATGILISAISTHGMVMAFNNPEIPIEASTPLVIPVIALVVFLTEIAIIKSYKKSGPLSPIAMRIGFYLIWHIIWPMIHYA